MDSIPVTSMRMTEEFRLYSDNKLKDDKAVLELIGKKLCNLPYEVHLSINLNLDMQPLSITILGIGSTSSVEFSIANLAQAALLSNAANVILVHNHPNQYSKETALASEADLKMADRCIKLLDMFDIRVLDDCIVFNKQQKDGSITPAVHSCKLSKELKFSNRTLWENIKHNYRDVSCKEFIKKGDQLKFEDFRPFHVNGVNVKETYDKEHPLITLQNEEEFNQYFDTYEVEPEIE